jgi:hypothetical protein
MAEDSTVLKLDVGRARHAPGRLGHCLPLAAGVVSFGEDLPDLPKVPWTRRGGTRPGAATAVRLPGKPTNRPVPVCGPAAAADARPVPAP